MQTGSEFPRTLVKALVTPVTIIESQGDNFVLLGD